MSAAKSPIDVIKGVMPLIQNAADLVATFTGTTEEARSSSVIGDALEVIGALAPLVDSFARGADVTLESAQAALAGMHGALSDLDAEIAKQGG